jgi:hypothetical protein
MLILGTEINSNPKQDDPKTKIQGGGQECPPHTPLWDYNRHFAR